MWEVFERGGKAAEATDAFSAASKFTSEGGATTWEGWSLPAIEPEALLLRETPGSVWGLAPALGWDRAIILALLMELPASPKGSLISADCFSALPGI